MMVTPEQNGRGRTMSDVLDREDALRGSAFVLAELVGVGCPDGPASPGATFLIDVRAEALDAWEGQAYMWGDAPQRRGDFAAEAAWEGVESMVVNQGTLDMWRTFVDLAGWVEEDSGSLESNASMSARAADALCQIGARVVSAVVAELVFAASDEAEGVTG
jgi:hypothetical protein